MSAKEKIENALKELGVHGKIRIENIGWHIWLVYINGEVFGIYDTDKNTFVD